MRKQLVIVAVIVMAASGMHVASADIRAVGTPATYKGKTIDLSRDWQGARACAVLSADDIRCYSSQAEQWRELARLRRPSQPTSSELLDTYCLNRSDLFLTLYQNTSFGGSSLSLNAADVWHNLSSFSFDDITSSWVNNTYCDVTAATGTSGGGSTTTFSARSSSTDVGSSWNDVISSVKIVT